MHSLLTVDIVVFIIVWFALIESVRGQGHIISGFICVIGSLSPFYSSDSNSGAIHHIDIFGILYSHLALIVCCDRGISGVQGWQTFRFS